MWIINCKINLSLTWSTDCVISATTGTSKFAITDTKLYVLVVTLLTQDNAKLLQEFKSGFKRTINWNKYQSNVIKQTQPKYLDYLIDASFHGVNGIFVLFLKTVRLEQHTTRWSKRFWSKNVWQHSKNCNRSSRWLYNYFFDRLI